jgi:hypothetical protein
MISEMIDPNKLTNYPNERLLGKSKQNKNFFLKIHFKMKTMLHSMKFILQAKLLLVASSTLAVSHFLK